MLRDVLLYIFGRGLLYGGLATLALALLDALAETASRQGWLPL
ncbi:hypothetical protein [Aquitalea sp. LB_tupeE]|nr:hypothetical protein [Aquitalea sp. LB_tupeE]